MTHNLFDNAKFGDMFLTTENKQAVFLRFSENAEYKFAILYVEGWGNVQVFRHNGKEIYNDATHSIISKQEEPVSNPTPNKKMSVERWKKACEAACCDRNYRSHYGLTETRDDYFVDGVQWADEHPKEEPVKRTPADIEAAMQEVEDKSRVFTEAHKGEDADTILAQMRGEEPVIEELEEASKNYALNNTPWDDCKDEIQESFKAGAEWGKNQAMAEIQAQSIALAHGCPKESITEGLGDYINELSKQFPEVSFAKLSRIAVRVAKWHNEHLWKHADGNNLPIIDREVIALLDNGKVVFAHRPPEYWDGKDIITGKVTRNYVERYDNGLWNIPNVKYWLDVNLPKQED